MNSINAPTSTRPCPFCGQPTSRYGAREGQVPHDRCETHGAVGAEPRWTLTRAGWGAVVRQLQAEAGR